MAKRTLTKESGVDKNYYPNHRVIGDVNITIQNNTGDTLTLEVSNQDSETPAFTAPSQGVVSIANGAMESITDPYFVYKFSGSGAGTISIVEPY